MFYWISVLLRKIPYRSVFYLARGASAIAYLLQIAFAVIAILTPKPKFSKESFSNLMSSIKNTTESVSKPKEGLAESYFDGRLIQRIAWKLLGGFIIILTAGICAPWAFTMMFRWEASHTVINGKRQTFDGNGGQLFVNWFIWLLLSIVTCGIYALWIPIKVTQWKVKHTHFIDV